jgi:hypothetical protein
MTGNFLGLSRRFILCLLIICFSNIVLFSQTDTVVNKYARVLTRSDYQVVVDDGSAFSNGDYVLIIQMQGVAIDASDSPSYGQAPNQLVGIPGRYEFLIIQNITSNTITFLSKINKYNPAGNVQIIKVPFFNSLNTSKILTCKPWDKLTKTGGVLAMILGNTLTLNQNIDVSGKGFSGGKDTIGLGNCSYPSGINNKYSFPGSFQNAGNKGEGLASHQSFCLDPCVPALLSLYLKGQGPLFTGGGGGNGKFSGGGGGANRGHGGQGGKEYYTCPSPVYGGNQGVSVTASSDRLDTITGGIFMGGGGGASTKLVGSVSQPGGNGGGIVIIVTDQLIGNGYKIIADGKNVSTAKLNSGAGGGGAGGSVIISSNSLLNVELSVRGGKGGNHLDDFGQGGGGGGGLLWISQNSKPATVTNTLTGGDAGIDTILVTTNASPGDPGLAKYNFKAQLNGFLFNSIRSSVTGDQTDSICSNMMPQKINGTVPVGGIPPYTYKWEKSYNLSTWTTLVNDADPTNYTPKVIETTTVYYRRTITDSSLPTAIIDLSKPVKVIVQPFIKNNIVGNSDTICFAQDPQAFTSKATLQDGNGKYAFNWGVSLNNSLFSVPANTHNAEGYDPPAGLKVTSWYRRTVTSGRCLDSTAIVKITVIDTIRNNRVLNSPPDICYGSAFVNLTATTPLTTPALSGGDNSYIYSWESNVNGAGWATAPGVSNGTGYNPVELPQRTPSNQYLYRRIVYSGSNNVCASASNEVLLKDFPVITNNTITPVSPVCSGLAPSTIIGSKTPTLAGGNASYSYSWEDSTKLHSWANISGATGADYQPPVLTDTTLYRRTVTSTCVNTSNSIKIIVHKPILNNNITVLGGGITETICNNQQPGQFQGTNASAGIGSFLYQWKSSSDNSVFTSVPSGGTGINYQPSQLSATTYYKREVTSGACILNSNTITETVLPTITNNIISGNAKVCYSLIPDAITGATLSGGSGVFKYFWWQSTDGGVNWVAAPGANNTPTYQPPALFSPVKYERTVTSGPNDCCSSTSNIFDIGIDPLPASKVYAGPDTIIYSVDKIYHMKAIVPVLTETGIWAVLNNGTSSFDDTTKYNTTVRKLIVGKNSFLWTIHRGPCILKDSVNVVLLEDFVPQGFSPNGDAWNNTFVIEGLNLDDNYVDLSIVNSAGTEVFKTSNRDNQKWTDWDGKNSKGIDLAEGTYYYLLKITSNSLKGGNGQVFKKSGFIILKRY